MRKATRRKLAIVIAYLAVTGGYPPRQLGELLQAMREFVGNVTEHELHTAITWARRQPLPRLRMKAPHQRSKRQFIARVLLSR